MSFCLVILYKIIAFAVAGSVQCAQFGPVWIMLRFSARKEAVDVELWLVGDFDLLLSRDASNMNFKRFKWERNVSFQQYFKDLMGPLRETVTWYKNTL